MSSFCLAVCDSGLIRLYTRMGVTGFTTCTGPHLSGLEAVALVLAAALEALGHARVRAVGARQLQDLRARRHDAVPLEGLDVHVVRRAVAPRGVVARIRTGCKQSEEEEEELDLERAALCVPGTIWANSQRSTPHHGADVAVGRAVGDLGADGVHDLRAAAAEV
jgi:hypothetical protein